MPPADLCYQLSRFKVFALLEAVSLTAVRHYSDAYIPPGPKRFMMPAGHGEVLDPVHGSVCRRLLAGGRR